MISWIFLIPVLKVDEFVEDHLLLQLLRSLIRHLYYHVKLPMMV